MIANIQGLIHIPLFYSLVFLVELINLHSPDKIALPFFAITSLLLDDDDDDGIYYYCFPVIDRTMLLYTLDYALICTKLCFYMHETMLLYCNLINLI